MKYDFGLSTEIENICACESCVCTYINIQNVSMCMLYVCSMCVSVCVYAYVHTYVCIYVCMYVCMCILYVLLCTYVHIPANGACTLPIKPLFNTVPTKYMLTFSQNDGSSMVFKTNIAFIPTCGRFLYSCVTPMLKKINEKK